MPEHRVQRDRVMPLEAADAYRDEQQRNRGRQSHEQRQHHAHIQLAYARGHGLIQAEEYEYR